MSQLSLSVPSGLIQSMGNADPPLKLHQARDYCVRGQITIIQSSTMYTYLDPPVG